MHRQAFLQHRTEYVDIDPFAIMTTESEKPDALQVHDADPAPTTTHGQHQHHKEIHVLPIDEEALEDVHHINLTWRSWV